MKTLSFLILLFLVFIPYFSYADYRPGDQDHYQDFSSMTQSNVEGEDYLVRIKNNNSNILVTAFHGGYIESGTSELAIAISENTFDLYSFEALKPGDMHKDSFTSSTLHITSTRFDDPKLLSMLPEKDFCLGLHGFGGQEADFCVGGGNELERKNLVKLLSEHFPQLKSCELCCPPFNGVSKKNPINLCKNQGVQVEMSPDVRKEILSNPVFLKNISTSFKAFLSPLQNNIYQENN